MPLKKKVFDILAISKERGSLSWYADIFIIALIIVNVAAILAQSVDRIYLPYKQYFYYFEVFSVVIFTVEYILRVWSANIDPKYKTPFWGNIRYALTPLAIIDFLAFFPFYLSFVGIDLRILRMLRIFRIFRLFKAARYMGALSMMHRVIVKKKEELVISLLFTLFLLTITSTLMYYVENSAQPDVFTSIPETMWWGIATLTTVGYGDVYPVTNAGQFLGGVIAIIGVGLFALPTGILAAGFSDELSRKKIQQHKCPTCGQKLPENNPPQP